MGLRKSPPPLSSTFRHNAAGYQTLGNFMLRGSCLGGGARYEISGTLSGALNCHRSMFRKAHGAAFRSRARVRAADFRWVRGEELVTYYESSPGDHRGFCRVCGSPLRSRFDHDSSTYGLPLAAACWSS